MSAFAARFSRPILPFLYYPSALSRTSASALIQTGSTRQLPQWRSLWTDARDPLLHESNSSLTSCSSPSTSHHTAPRSTTEKRPWNRNSKSRSKRSSKFHPLSGYDPPENVMDVLRIATSLLADTVATRHDAVAATAKSSHITAAEAWAAGSTKTEAVLALKPLPNAFSGRSIFISKSTPEGFAQSFRKLQGILRANNVYQTVRAQKRHEKKGVKRRRLASQTHRRKFAQLIRGKVALVQKYRARGS